MTIQSKRLRGKTEESAQVLQEPQPKEPQVGEFRYNVNTFTTQIYTGEEWIDIAVTSSVIDGANPFVIR